ncbi:MAG: 50S ribosomal protein L25/general stress protein Ctc [Proteobacteria bacterium]|nr:50S ribosomal protein L25/general stress protein Ctc [Pseudomonadota bacterium]
MAGKNTALTALTRAKAGKGAARATRRTGQIPGVVYGDNKETVLISLTEKDLAKATSTQGFFTSLCNLDVAGQKFLVVPRDVQVDPVTDRPVHVDFLRVTDKTIIRVGIPVHVKNQKDCPGLTKGGVLNIVRHEIDVLCRATDIPEEFVVDLSALDVGSSIHIGDIKMPPNVKSAVQGNFTVITLVAPSAMKSEVEEAAAAAAAATAAAEAAAAAPAVATGAPGATPGAAAAPAAAAKGAATAPAAAKGSAPAPAAVAKGAATAKDAAGKGKK